MDYIKRHRNPFILLGLLLFATVLYAADTKLTGLSQLNDAGPDDLVYIVDDPNGTPASYKVPLQEFSLRITSLGTIATGTWEATVVDHERGGLEADINAYSGLVAVSGGSTSEVDDKSELEGQIADVADFAEADGDTYTGAHDFGGATSIELVNGTDPDVDAMGEVSVDSDGANEANDVTLRVTDTGGDTQYMLACTSKEIFTKTIVAPQDFADGTRDLAPLWMNGTGMTLTITEIRAWSDTDDTTVNLELVTAIDFSGLSTVDALEIATNGTSVYYVVETTITDATIAHDEGITADFDDTDDPGWVMIQVRGYFDADVD